MRIKLKNNRIIKLILIITTREGMARVMRTCLLTRDQSCDYLTIAMDGRGDVTINVNNLSNALALAIQQAATSTPGHHCEEAASSSHSTSTPYQ